MFCLSDRFGQEESLRETEKCIELILPDIISYMKNF